MLLHVYAILNSKPSELELQSLGISNLRLIEASGLFALVSNASEQTEPTKLAIAALEHNAVIERALEFSSLLPARFTAPLEEHLILTQLKHNQAAYQTALDRVRNALEFALRAEVAAITPEPVANNTSSGRAYLESRRTQFNLEHQNRTKLEAIAASLEQQLGSLAREVLHRYEPNLYRGCYLVCRDNTEVFKHAFEVIQPSFQDDLEQLGLHGPFAPYSFATLENTATEGVL